MTYCNLPVALGLAAAIAGPLAMAAPAADAPVWLCLTPTRAAGELARVATGPDGEFALSFIHSVSKTPVTDLYRVEDGRIIQTAEIFETHGAGLPSIAGDVGATGWRHENGQFIIDLHRPMGPIHLRVQPVYGNTLHTPNTELRLARLGVSAVTLAPCPPETTN